MQTDDMDEVEGWPVDERSRALAFMACWWMRCRTDTLVVLGSDELKGRHHTAAKVMKCVAPVTRGSSGTQALDCWCTCARWRRQVHVCTALVGTALYETVIAAAREVSLEENIRSIPRKRRCQDEDKLGWHSHALLSLIDHFAWVSLSPGLGDKVFSRQRVSIWVFWLHMRVGSMSARLRLVTLHHRR
jgi:hypothetical protein